MPLSGSLNDWVITLNFNNGVKWVFRWPRMCPSASVKTDPAEI